MQIVPLQPVPSQTVQAQLNGQSCTINVYQKRGEGPTGGALYIDLYVASVLIIGGVICQNLNRIVRDSYLGFIGDMAFLDTIADTDPYYTGLGSQYQLAYLAPADLPAGSP
jgi:hypothetical protein